MAQCDRDASSNMNDGPSSESQPIFVSCQSHFDFVCIFAIEMALNILMDNTQL